MKLILKSVTINEVASKESTVKETGERKIYRNVDIFIPRDKEDEYSKPKSISAKVIDGPIGVGIFDLLSGMEGQKVCLEGNYTEEKHFVAKGQKYDMPESFVISAVIDVASIKAIETGRKMKAAA